MISGSGRSYHLARAALRSDLNRVRCSRVGSWLDRLWTRARAKVTF